MLVKGIILRTIPYQESGLILHFLTADHGRIHAIARGARASRKRFGGGVLEVLNFCELQLTPGKTAESLATLQEAKLLDDFAHLRKDFDLLQTALEFVKTVDTLALINDPASQQLYNLLGHTLKQMTDTELRLPFRVRFCIRLLRDQGVLEAQDWMEPWLKVKNQNLHELKLLDKPSETQVTQLMQQLQEYTNHFSKVSH